jgi:uncharacterized protein (DUF1778 family)
MRVAMSKVEAQDKRAEYILQGVREFKTLATIGRELGISRERARQIIRPKTYRGVTRERNAQVLERIKEPIQRGMATEKIANEFNIPHWFVKEEATKLKSGQPSERLAITVSQDIAAILREAADQFSGGNQSGYIQYALTQQFIDDGLLEDSAIASHETTEET